MYRVKQTFRDIANPQNIFQIGDNFSSDNELRIKNLLERGLIEEVPEEMEMKPEEPTEPKEPDEPKKDSKPKQPKGK